jgi:hypothetical protein
MSPPLSEHRLVSFWPLQMGGWLLYGSTTAVSYIPFWDMRNALIYRAAILCSAFLASFILRLLCRFLWRRPTPLFSALLACSALSYVLGVGSAVVGTWADTHIGNSTTTVSWSGALANGVGAALILITWSTLYFGIKNYLSAQDREARLIASEASAREAQLQALRYQLQPHFLFNTLNAISALVVSQQPETATETIAKLASLLRHALNSPEIHAITLREELGVVREYLSIEKVRFGSRLSVSFDISSESEEAEVPRFLLQPLVENAIRHGVARRSNGGNVAIHARVADRRLQITIENDKPEFATDNHDQGHGVGLANTRSRLKALYGEDAIATTTQTERFRIAVSIPLRIVSLEPGVEALI